MNDDLIVDEVRRVREDSARRFNYDIHALFADLRERQNVADPAHPLVRDARESADSSKDVSALREGPPPPEAVGGREGEELNSEKTAS